MSESEEGPVLDLPEDAPPKGGTFADWEGSSITPEEADAGERLGEVIDADDDEDSGEMYG